MMAGLHPGWWAVLAVSLLALLARPRRRAPAPTPTGGSGSWRERVIAFAESHLGDLYIWGGESEELEGGFDCSGLVSAALAAAGVQPVGYRQTADAMWRAFTPVTDPQPGDLVFWGRGPTLGRPQGRATHIGIVTGPGQAISASGGGPSTTTPDIARAQGAQVKRHGIGYRRDLLGYRRAA